MWCAIPTEGIQQLESFFMTQINEQIACCQHIFAGFTRLLGCVLRSLTQGGTRSTVLLDRFLPMVV